MIRILLADDHALLRTGLKQILADEFPKAEFGEAGTSAETLHLLRQRTWDVLILDLNMPGRSGFELLAESRASFPGLPVLVLSSTPEEQIAMRVLRAGASGYLNKQVAPEELVHAVRKVTGGGCYVSELVAEKLAEELGRVNPRAPHETLSDREFQVFQMTTTGKSVKEIAAQLSLSVKTVSTFRSRVFEKLGVTNDVELTHYAIEHELVAKRPGDPSPPS